MPDQMPSIDHRVQLDGSKLLELLQQHVPQDFDPDDFVIAGSARLWVGGISPYLSDLDILVRPGSPSWERAQEIAFAHAPLFGNEPMRVSEYSGDKIAQLYGGDIEVCERWVTPGSNTEQLLTDAEHFGGLKYLSIRDVIIYKRYLGRPKDKADLALIDPRLNHPLWGRWLNCRHWWHEAKTRTPSLVPRAASKLSATFCRGYVLRRLVAQRDFLFRHAVVTGYFCFALLTMLVTAAALHGSRLGLLADDRSRSGLQSR